MSFFRSRRNAESGDGEAQPSLILRPARGRPILGLPIQGWTGGAPCEGPLIPKCHKGFVMSRMPMLSSPFMLGFDEIERALDRVTKTTSDGYPPYNIERMQRTDSAPERLRITLAVAGFRREELEVTLEENQLVIRGRQVDDKTREYLHRGIAARQFQRAFLLAEGMEVLGADLSNGLLAVDLARPEPERIIRKIDILEKD